MSHQLSWEATLSDGTSHEEWLKANVTKYTQKEIAGVLGRSEESVRKKIARLELQCRRPQITHEGGEVEGIPIEALLAMIKDKPLSLKELSAKFDRSENTMRRAIEQLQGLSYEISQTETSKHLWSTKAPGIVAPPTILWDKATWEFKLGVLSDSHWGSKAAQFNALIKAVDIMYERGIRHILHCGDLNAGRNVYSGQELDNVTMRADEQLALTVSYWPQRDGLHYYIMGGNHDWSLVRHGGFNAVKAACKARDDFTYCGFNLATIPLTNEIDALMWHPSGGVPYAVSYRAQKMAEQVAMEQLMETLEKKATPKVRFLFCGHLHIFVQFWQGPIFVGHVGCFEGQTDYLKKKALYPHLGCLILEGNFTREMALIHDLTVTHLRFTEIQDDYLNYPIPSEDKIVIEPMFQWIEETSKEK